MRRLSSLVAVAALLSMLFPATMTAATRTTERVAQMSCGIQSELGTLFLFAELNSAFGSVAEAVFWEEGLDPEQDAATSFGFDGVVTVSAGGLAGTIPMFDDETGEPVGDLTFDATFTPIGDPESFSESGRDGNRWFRTTGSFQAQDVAGAAALDDVGPFDLAMSCDGVTATITTVGNAPAAYVRRSTGALINCQWETETDLTYFNVSVDGFETNSSFGHFSFDETTGVSGFGEGTIGGGAFSASFEIFDDETGDIVGTGSAEGTATLVGGRSRQTNSDGLGTYKVVSRILAVDGTLTVEIDGVVDEIALDGDQCVGETNQIKVKSVAPKGPAAKPLVNDTPDGAVALTRLPAKVLTNTGLTAALPEAPCIEVFEGEVFEVSLGFTAWWTFTGTGRDVTVNTAKSTFDTVLGVYRLDGEDLEQIDCVDDVFDEESFSFLARATIPTEQGATYYVQVGGFGEGSGRMQLTVR